MKASKPPDSTGSSRGGAVKSQKPARAERERQVAIRRDSANALVDRERVVSAREETMLVREAVVRARVETLRGPEETVQTGAEVERLMGRIREVNERLIVAAVHAQTMSEEAREEAAQAKTELEQLMGQMRDANERLVAATAHAQAMAEEAERAKEDLIREKARLAETASAARATSLRMSYLAQHDVLTDLPNRQLLNDRLGGAIALARRYGRQLAVLFVDLDHFKHINDAQGHTSGDQLLKSVAERLLTCIRSSDTVSRYGGDEFLVLLSEIADAGDAAVSVRKIMTALTRPYRIAQHDLHITVSMGISVFPGDGQDAETLIKRADIAMYRAKEQGRDGYQFFKEDLYVAALERQSLEGSLRNAVGGQEFVLHYQPKMNLETGAIIGAEALIRWRHPDRGLVPPAQFVPIAEDCGLIVPIGQWALHEACRQTRAWQDAGQRPLPVSVNISAVELKANGFLEGVRGILQKTHLEPRYLELELTETVLMAHAEITTPVLQALKAMGMQLAVDDFGTGYSSLSYLAQFPIDTLKIDQSFVHRITADPDGAPIITAVISMGKSLKHRVIAEGVETQEQLAFLRAQRCGEGQGFYFSRPLAAEQFATLLGTGVAGLGT